MNRNFENRKPTKVYAKSKENQMIIKALNMYGRVPETWELLEEIERLNNIINELEKYCIDEKEDLISGCEVCEDILKMIDKLKEKYLNVVADDDLEYVKKLQQENKQLKEVIDKVTNDLQQIIDNVKDRTIISLGQFIPKLEIIQDELNGSNDILKERCQNE